MGGGKTTQKTKYNNTQTTAPPAWTAPGLDQAAGMVTAGLDQIPTEHYSGPQVAYMTPDQLAAIQGAWGGTAANADSLAGWMQGMLPTLQQGPQFNYSGAPGISTYNMGSLHDMDPVINAAIDPVRRQLMEQILPSQQSSALESGAYSGDRAMRVMPLDAIDRATESMQRIAAGLGYENYNNFENRRLQAYQTDQGNILQAYGLDTERGLGTANDNLNRMSLIPSYVNDILRTQGSSGDLLRMAAELGVNRDQAMITDATQRDMYASQAPFMGLDTASQLLAALSGSYGTQTGSGNQTTTTKKSMGLGDALGAAAGIASMAMGFPGVAGALGLGGSAAAMGAGSGLGALNASSLFAHDAPTVFNPFSNWPHG